MNNDYEISDDMITLAVSAAAWQIEFTVTPKSGAVIGVWHAVLTQNYGAGETYEYFARNNNGKIDYDSRYTAASPFYGAINVWDCTILDEEKSYQLAVSYDVYENGVLTKESVVLSINCTTVSRAESGETGYGGTLAIETVSGFSNKRSCTFSIILDKRHFNGGTIFVQAAVSGTNSGLSKTYTQNNMFCDEDEVPDSAGEMHKRAIYTLTVDKEDIGYGICTVTVDVTYKCGLNIYYSPTAYGNSVVLFGFIFREPGGKFKLRADEWNEYMRLLASEVERRGAVAYVPPEVSAGDAFELYHISFARNLILQLAGIGISGLPSESTFPVLTKMTFGQRPENGISAYELFGNLEDYVNMAISS